MFSKLHLNNQNRLETFKLLKKYICIKSKIAYLVLEFIVSKQNSRQ